MAKGVHDGLWLGAAGNALLDRIDDAFYRADGLYCDPAYNRSGLLAWEADAVDRWFEGRSRLAVTGAGGGREVLALVGDGREPVGFECNPLLRDAANALLAEEGTAARVHPVARHQWPAEPPGSYDGVIVGWGSFMLTPGRARRVEFLRGARAATAEGCPVLVSFYCRPTGRAYFSTVAAVAGAVRRARRQPPVERGDALTPNYVHYFTEAEIAGELADGGFEPVSFAAEPYGHAVGLAR